MEIYMKEILLMENPLQKRLKNILHSKRKVLILNLIEIKKSTDIIEKLCEGHIL
jgi:hypothetical protein